MKLFVLIIVAALGCGLAYGGERRSGETLAEIGARLGVETEAAYQASPFFDLSRDYFSRLMRDPAAQPKANETVLDSSWRIVLPDDAAPLAAEMATHLADFLARRMEVAVNVSAVPRNDLAATQQKAIVLLDSGGGESDKPESFTISVSEEEIRIAGEDIHGLRDGVVRLVDRVGFREAPFLEQGAETRAPRLKVRLGVSPRFAGASDPVAAAAASKSSYRELIFMGYNAVMAGGGSLYALSTSDAIPELKSRQQEGALERHAAAVADAHRHGLKAYAMLDRRQKFPKDDPVFQAHPDIRGALTWTADGEYVLCTEHPLVQQWLAESVEGLFRASPDLEGVMFIVGGESFYHCYMRPYGVERGHTNCPRCEEIGAETVVANLCNLIARAARKVNPEAEVLAWPYSAHVWSKDDSQLEFISKLESGTGIHTEIEKDEYVEKSSGVRKHLWDYSIDLIGPGERAKQQIAACKARGISVYLKSEPELGFEAPRLPHIPCMDRWLDRAEALASSGADGAWVFPAFRSNYGTSAAEVAKFAWWSPTPDNEEILDRFAARWVGKDAAPHLREAWRRVSAAIPESPELPSYYTGPYYLGPAHPMCANPEAELPDVFYGAYLFYAEMADAEGVKLRPTFVTSPTGDAAKFEGHYRRMESELKLALEAIEKADPLVDASRRLLFEAEASPVRWFYHTARTEANFYESCRIRDVLQTLASRENINDDERAQAAIMYKRWVEVLEDERANAQAALPVMENDVRLDWYYGSDHTFPHGADMIRAKLELIDDELQQYLPGLAARLGLSTAQ